MLAGCSNGGEAAPEATPTATPAPSDESAVPWTADPAPPLVVATPLSMAAPDLNGPPCSASDVEITFGPGNGGGGTVLQFVAITNTSPDDCILDGYPSVSVVTPDGIVEAGHNPLLLTSPEGTGGRLHPGESGRVAFETTFNCDARFVSPPPFPTKVANTLIFRFGGGEQAVPYQVDVLCGLNVQRFVVGNTDPVYPPSPFVPLAALQIDVLLPPSVARGSTLHYVVALTNPTDHDISLDPCPSYLEDGIEAKEGIC
jgi:hypothetical protein